MHKKGGVTTFPLRPYVDKLTTSVADKHFRFEFMVAGHCRLRKKMVQNCGERRQGKQNMVSRFKEVEMGGCMEFYNST